PTATLSSWHSAPPPPLEAKVSAWPASTGHYLRNQKGGSRFRREPPFTFQLKYANGRDAALRPLRPARTLALARRAAAGGPKDLDRFRRRDFRLFDTLDRLAIERDSERPLDASEVHPIVGRHHADGAAFAAHPRRASDAMDVILRLVR